MKLKRTLRRIRKLITSTLLGCCCSKRQSSTSSSSSTESSVSSGKNNHRKPFKDICAVCLEPVASNGRRYALLERCDHRYCEPCGRSLVAHRDHGQTTVRCPTCRVPSSSMVASKERLTAGEQKASLFSPAAIDNLNCQQAGSSSAANRQEEFLLRPQPLTSLLCSPAVFGAFDLSIVQLSRAYDEESFSDSDFDDDDEDDDTFALDEDYDEDYDEEDYYDDYDDWNYGGGRRYYYC